MEVKIEDDVPMWPVKSNPKCIKFVSILRSMNAGQSFELSQKDISLVKSAAKIIGDKVEFRKSEGDNYRVWMSEKKSLVEPILPPQTS